VSQANIPDTEHETIRRRLQALIDVCIPTRTNHANRHVRHAALTWLYVLARRVGGSAFATVLRDSNAQRLQTACAGGLSEPNGISAFTRPSLRHISLYSTGTTTMQSDTGNSIR
jgi:hypothetical protein